MRTTLAAIVTGLALATGCMQPDATEATEEDAMLQLANLIDERIVEGMPREDVEHVLKDAGVEYSYVTVDRLARFDLPAEPEAYYATISGRFNAIARNVAQTGVVQESLMMQIDVGRDGRVARVKVEPGFTAP